MFKTVKLLNFNHTGPCLPPQKVFAYNQALIFNDTVTLTVYAIRAYELRFGPLFF